MAAGTGGTADAGAAGPFLCQGRTGPVNPARRGIRADDCRVRAAARQRHAAPFAIFEPVLADELGADWRNRFVKVAEGQPLGSASLAQVYEVILPDGSRGVLKVQRPDIRKLVLDDMAMVGRAARLVARCAPTFNAVVDIKSTLNVVFEAMRAELDFTVEAASMARARELVADFDYLDVPEVLVATPRVMVQTLAPGQSIRDVDPAVLSDQERRGIGRDLLAFMYRGYFVDRFFHADPHPGNIFVALGTRPL